jgi:hypothetical protein
MYYQPGASAFYTLVLSVKVIPVGKTGKWCVFGGYADGFNDFNGTYSWRTLSKPFSADALMRIVTPERLCPGSRWREQESYLRQIAVRSRDGFMTTHPVRAETNAQVLRLKTAIAGAASLTSCTSRSP